MYAQGNEKGRLYCTENEARHYGAITHSCSAARFTAGEKMPQISIDGRRSVQRDHPKHKRQTTITSFGNQPKRQAFPNMPSASQKQLAWRSVMPSAGLGAPKSKCVPRTAGQEASPLLGAAVQAVILSKGPPGSAVSSLPRQRCSRSAPRHTLSSPKISALSMTAQTITQGAVPR